MFDLTKRFLNLSKAGTPNNIGPNTYIICDERESRLQRKNAVPFQSSTIRTTGLGGTCYTDTLLRPCDCLVSKRITGGSSLQNKAIRLKRSVLETPGPTTYDPKIQEKGCKYKPPPCHGKGRLYVCRVPYSVYASSPSVPTHIDENGYAVDVEGNLVKCPQDEHDLTLGPAFYRVPRGEMNFSTLRYHKGCRWSKSKTKRFAKSCTEGPGPGYYDPNIDLCAKNPRDEEYRSLARYFSFFPRYTEGEMLRLCREAIPGPGEYNVNDSSFQCPKSLSINPRPFIVATERFASKSDDTPGPGAYDVCEEVPIHQYPFFLKRHPAFGAVSSRFKSKTTSDLPAPNTYDVPSPIKEKLLGKMNIYSTVDVPFCRTSERKIGFISPEAEFLPAPGDYELRQLEVEKKTATASVFRSKAPRFPCKRLKDPGGPARYNISEQFNINHNRRSHHTGKVPFLSSSRGRMSGVRRTTKSPGPADYIGQAKAEFRGLSFNVTPRFQAVEDDLPGPATYSVHPSVGLSIYKAIGTHNLRLKENVLRCKLKEAPTATRAKWCAILKKKKKLKWFEEHEIKEVDNRALANFVVE